MSRNLFNEYIDFEKKQIFNLMSLILEKYFDLENFNKLLDFYINSRYFDYYERENLDFRSSICDGLRRKALELMDDKRIDVKMKIKEMLFCFNFVLYFDDVINDYKISNYVNYIYEYRKKLRISTTSDFKGTLIKLVEENRHKKESFISGFKSNSFFLSYFNTSNSNVFMVNISHNIKFPKIYSYYSIDRVFNTGIIGEDKLFIEYSLISIEILNNIINCICNKYYIVQFCESLFDKKDKIDRLLNIVNNDFVKDKIAFLIDVSTYNKYSDIIKSYMVNGYMFAIFLGNKFIPSIDEFNTYDIFKYIVVNNNSKYCQFMDKNDKIICINLKRGD